MADFRETVAYKNYEKEARLYENYRNPLTVGQGSLSFSLSKGEEAGNLEPTATVHDVTAKLQRWKLAMSGIAEVTNEVNAYIRDNVNPLMEVLGQANYNVEGDNLQFMKDQFTKATEFIKAELKVLKELVGNVEKYPTIELWEAYKDAQKELTGEHTDDLGEAKKGVIAQAEKLAGGKRNLYILGAIAILGIYFFMFHKKK